MGLSALGVRERSPRLLAGGLPSVETLPFVRRRRELALPASSTHDLRVTGLPRVDIQRHMGRDSSWEVATCVPRGPLKTAAQTVDGYVERTSAPLVRFEGPIARVVVIFDLGPGLEVVPSHRPYDGGSHRSGFVAGLGDYAASVRHEGFQSGVQVNLAPSAASDVLGISMNEIAGRVVTLDDLLPRPLRDLPARLAGMESWRERLAEVESGLGARLRLTPPSPARQVVRWAERILVERGGRARLRDLAEHAGYSEKHFRRIFKTQIGVSPRTFARVVRFERLTEMAKAAPEASLGELAFRTGFWDEAHLSREIRSVTGVQASVWRRQLVPFSAMSDSYKVGVAADRVGSKHGYTG